MNRTALPYLVIVAATLGAIGLATHGIRSARADSSKKAKACPDASLGETASDCPWAMIARTMIEEAPKAKKGALAARFKKLAPELDRAIQGDAKRLSWKTLWGRSINFDELAKEVIVAPAIVELLETRFGITAVQKPLAVQHIKEKSFDEVATDELLGTPAATDAAGHPLVHAGLEHTYGYLFSVLKTSFGYKRARWVDGEIEKGFGIPAGLLGPRPSSGSLFGNVTYFIGRIAFRGDAEPLKTIKKGAAPAALSKLDYDKLKIVRLEEAVEAKDESRKMRKVTFRTDFVSFTKSGTKNTHLLVYSVNDPSNGGSVLISAFPVAASFMETVTKTDELGEGKPVKSRYNAYVEGVSGQDLKGSRKVIP